MSVVVLVGFVGLGFVLMLVLMLLFLYLLWKMLKSALKAEDNR